MREKITGHKEIMFLNELIEMLRRLPKTEQVYCSLRSVYVFTSLVAWRKIVGSLMEFWKRLLERVSFMVYLLFTWPILNYRPFKCISS